MNKSHQESIKSIVSNESSSLLPILSSIESSSREEELTIDNSRLNKPGRRAKVVVIGSGLAGLAAAQRLKEAGINDVIILEALDRVGGRVHTIKHRGYLLELGAQWLHGADDNPLYKWLTELDMLDDFEDAAFGFKGSFCTDSGVQIDESLVNRVLDIVCKSKLALSKDKDYLNKFTSRKDSKIACCSGDGSKTATTMQDDNNNFNNNNNLPLDQNMLLKSSRASEVFRWQLELAIEQDPELAKQRQLVNSLFEWFLRYETIENCCDSMDEVSVQSYTDWTDLGDGTLLNFKNGYSSLVDWFCSRLPSKRSIYLNKQVVGVERLTKRVPACSGSSSDKWLDPATGRLHQGPVLIRYKSTGAKQDELETIECDHVIVTVSLGFLKQNMDTFFVPPLAESRRNLINSIGCGTVNKIILQFERPFWQPNCGGIKLVWPPPPPKHDPGTASDEKLCTDCEAQFPAWARDILSFDLVRKQPNLLIGWIGGQGAKMIEHESEELIGQTCLRVLTRFLPHDHARPTKLLACLCSRWNSNPFTCGSYSFQSMSSFNMSLDQLHEPICSDDDDVDDDSDCESDNSNFNGSGGRGDGNCDIHDSSQRPTVQSTAGRRIPRILFAGEATAGKLYSTTHGAIISGWREADRLTDHLLPQPNLTSFALQPEILVSAMQTTTTTTARGNDCRISLSA